MKRNALTLVEVLAALLILGGSATSILVVQSRALELTRQAKLEAASGEMARELIASWRLESVNTREPAAGILDAWPGWSWRRFSQTVTIGDDARAVQVTLELMYESDEPLGPWARRFTWLEREHDAQ